jgi:hypothetical protein
VAHHGEGLLTTKIIYFIKLSKYETDLIITFLTEHPIPSSDESYAFEKMLQR